MADNAEGAIPFGFDSAPSAGSANAFFPFNPGTENATDPTQKLDLGADSGVDSPNVPAGSPDGISDVNFAAISGVPRPQDKLSDSLNGPDDVVILGG